MYLRKIFCENMGPISHVDIEPRFTVDGNPKPLIFVGKNGSGKSILISNIVDSFFEFGDQAYSDLTHKVNAGHSYFKITGGNQIKLGEKSLCCFLQYSAGEDGNKRPYYLYHCGEFDFNAFKAKIGPQYSSFACGQEDQKNITQDKDLFEKEFKNNAIAYFPPERFSIPYWMGTAYSNSHDYGDVDFKDKFRDVLKKPIIVDNATQENTHWLIDVLIDAKAELIRTENNYMISEPLNYGLLRQSKENIERIISQIVEDKISLRLGYRNGGKSRLIIQSQEGQKAIAPTIDALSTGQMILLNMFLTIVRYADTTDINRSIRLQNIAGIVVIDEIELHLHSDLQRKVLPRLIKLFPKVQFIITSHSPLFLLGMREIFKDDGFDLYEMPDGRKIEIEDFAEFERAYDAMTTTRTHREKIQKAISEQVSANEKALIITEGPTDWMHLKRAWDVLQDQYPALQGRFEFFEYYPANCTNPEIPAVSKLDMGNSNLVAMAKQYAKLQQPREIIFIADADVPKATADLRASAGKYKSWGNNVFSFELPVPQHRIATPQISIEHYYQDAEMKKWKTIDGIPRRIFTGNEFDNLGFDINFSEYFCSEKKRCGGKNISVIDGGNDVKVYKIEERSEQTNIALTKMDFSTAILEKQPPFDNMDFSSFKLIFDVLLEIISPEVISDDSPTEDQSQKGVNKNS